MSLKFTAPPTRLWLWGNSLGETRWRIPKWGHSYYIHQKEKISRCIHSSSHSEISPAGPCRWAKVLSSSPLRSEIAVMTEWPQTVVALKTSVTCRALGSWSQPELKKWKAMYAVGGQAGLHNGTLSQKLCKAGFVSALKGKEPLHLTGKRLPLS